MHDPAQRPRRCAVLGSPIAHSLSPRLHLAAYQFLDLDWEYGRHDVTETELPAFLDGLDKSWRGLSLTMPLKEVALECVDDATPMAKIVSAVNTILFDDDRRRIGDNTDVPGMVAAVEERWFGQPSHGVILGGGATARSAVAVLAALTDHIEVYIRTPGRAERLRRVAADLRVSCEIRPWDDRVAALTAPLVLSTTPPGATDDLAERVPESPALLLDVTYVPWPTPLAAAWEAAGGGVVRGLDVLIHQAVLQVVAMTGRDVPVGVLRAAGESALAERGFRK
jgi:shikimate dehydrogenase